jgi:pimeloyl-ACP methyl ester carboxylesterase
MSSCPRQLIWLTYLINVSHAAIISVGSLYLSPRTIMAQAIRAILLASATAATYSLDDFYLARPGAHEAQLDLFLDYASNVALYPKFQAYFRDRKPPLLALWGRNDPFFLPPGAEAFRRDIPGADIRLVDTGHFALETHYAEIAVAIRDFMGRTVAAAA